MTDGYVSFITNWTNEVLYIGVTSDLERRMFEHKQKTKTGFSEKYNLDKLVYYEHAFSIEDAITREKQLKKWSRSKKNKLVDSANPDWDDLHDGHLIRSLDFARDDRREM